MDCAMTDNELCHEWYCTVNDTELHTSGVLQAQST